MESLNGKFYAEAALLLEAIGPNALSILKRRLSLTLKRTSSDIDRFIKLMIRRSFPSSCSIGSSGSFPLRSYLPESDLDIVLVVSDSIKAQEVVSILAVFNILCQNILETDSGASRDYVFTIRNVEFRNARTKLAHCVVNNLDVDITVNQLNALASNILLEEADRMIGMNHLFKKSLLLLKAWCSHEASKYCGVSILGSKDGMLSSYALSVMLLYIFTISHCRELVHPFSVFRYFLKFFSSFQWSRYVLTMDGPVVISSGLQKSDVQIPQTDSSERGNMFSDIIAKIKACTVNRGTPQISAPFPLRCCNVVDPINASNNLGFNISNDCLDRIDVALKGGHHHLETLIRLIGHPQQPLQVAPALFSSYDPMAGGISAFGIASSVSAGFGAHQPAYLSPSPTLNIPSRIRADSGNPILPGGVVLASGLLNGQAKAEQPLPGLEAAAKGNVGVGESEFVTVFFAQCRSRYMVNAGCRHDLLDHPKQKGSFFVQVGRPENNWRRVNGGNHGDASDEAEDNLDDPFAGNISSMWSEYLQASAVFHSTPANETMPSASNSIEQKNVFSVLSPTSEVTDPVKYEVVDHHADANPLSSVSNGEPKSQLERMNEAHIPAPVNESSNCEPSEAKLSPSPNKRCSDGSMSLSPGKNKAFSQFLEPSTFLGEREPTLNRGIKNTDDDVDEVKVATPVKSLPKRDKTVDEVPPTITNNLSPEPSFGHRNDKKKRQKSKSLLTTGMVPTTSSCRDGSNSQDEISSVAVCSVQSEDDRPGAIQEDESGGNGVVDVKNTIKNRTESPLRVTFIAFAILLLCFLISRAAFLSCFGEPVGIIRDICTVSKSISIAFHSDSCSNNSVSSSSFENLKNTDYDPPPKEILSSEAKILLRYMESPLSQRGHAHFESVSVWTTSGSNITLGPCDKLVQAFAELQTIHTENMNCDSSICTDKLLMPAFEESKSAILETEIKILNHFSRFYFVWRKDHDPVAATKICPHEPCFLSIYNSNIQSEGKYSLWLCKRSIDEVQDDESVMLFSATVKIGEPPFSSSKPVYSTLSVGSSLYLHIKPEGRPSPSLQWFKNGFLLPGQNQSVLYFNSVNKSDEGTYTCELKNIAGSYVWQEGAVSVRSGISLAAPTKN